MSRLLGIDIGTTSLKACIFDENGNELFSVSKAYDLITEGEKVEFPAHRYFELFKEAYDELNAKSRIDAFAIDTQGETLVFLDKNGVPLMNAIVWLDNRAEKEARAIEKRFGLREIYEKTGQTEVPAGYPAPKILWLKNNEPSLFARLDKVVLLEDYLLYRITGRFVCERSLYSSSLYLDIRTGEYWNEMLAFIGIDKGYLPTLCESGERVGQYQGAIVCTGALDQISCFLGAGCAQKGGLSETTGTALAVCAYAEELPPYHDGVKVSAYYIAKNEYCLLAWAPTAGMVMEWYKKNFYFDADFKRIDEEAKTIPLGAEGLVVAPNMRGSVMPVNDCTLRGGVYGVDLKHTRAHFARAIMESIACLLKQYLTCLDMPIETIVSLGGGARSALWNQIKADITRKRIVTLVNQETGCLGTAVYAGCGAGVYQNANETTARLAKQKSTFLPKENETDAKTAYQKYLQFENLLAKREK